MATLTEGMPEQAQPTAGTPSYKMVGDSKIPVSKSYGPVWKGRKDAAVKKRSEKKIDVAWQEANSYYNNDQTKTRDSGGAEYRSRGLNSKIILEYAEIENIIFPNTNSAVSALYAKNPAISVTTESRELEELGIVSESLVNILLAKKEAPGINLKPKVKRACVSTFLNNLGWIKVGWTAKEDSTEQALTDVADLSKQLQADDLTPQKIQEIEGKLRALDDKFSFLSESGPYCKWLPSTAILRDPQSVEEDLSDAYWAMERDFIPTAYLKAKWMTKDGEGRDVSVYEPTHYLSGSGAPDSSNTLYPNWVNNFSIFDSSKSYSELGFDSQEAYDQSLVSEVWWVWDKVTRRLFLYHDKCWTWPIWVWDDPFGFTTFFPWVPFYFYTSPQGGESKGEVSYYLDQQDAINLCNSLLHSVRAWASTKVGYDPTKMNNKTLNDYLFSNKLEGIPITVGEGQKMEDVLPRGLPHPATSQLQLFDKTPIYASIDKISVVNEVTRGGQFKTNTTNQAVQYYSNVAQSRFDAIIDQIEDGVGMVGYMVLQLCWQFMDQQTVATLVGQEVASKWTQLSKQQIAHMSVRVEGGSTQKPNSAGKKKEAMELGQILGQFAGASPVAVLLAMKVMQRAFSDSVDLTDDEWQMMLSSMQAQLMGPAAAPNDPNANPQSPQEAYQALIAKGVPPDKAQQIIQQALGQHNGTATNPQH
jgi:hypothetical protein